MPVISFDFREIEVRKKNIGYIICLVHANLTKIHFSITNLFYLVVYTFLFFHFSCWYKAALYANASN